MTAILINPYAFQPVLPAATREYRALTSAADQSSATLTVAACDIGTAAVGRHVFAMFFCGIEATRTVSSATIGGATAKVHASTSFTYASVARYHATLISAPLDAGATAAVAVTFNSSGSFSLIRCATWRVLGLQSDTPIDTVVASNNSGSIDVEEDGLLIGGLFTRNGGSNITASGWAEDFEAATTGTTRVFGASAAIGATAAGFAFSAAGAGGGGAVAMVAGSFR